MGLNIVCLAPCGANRRWGISNVKKIQRGCGLSQDFSTKPMPDVGLSRFGDNVVMLKTSRLGTEVPSNSGRKGILVRWITQVLSITSGCRWDRPRI